jgi:CheY-like chemotaxis protein
VLVVDDNQFNILALKSILLDNFDIEVQTAVNGQLAVEIVKEAFNKECRC